VRVVSGINLPLCLGLIVLGPWLTIALFGREFEGSRAALAWLSAGYGAAALTVVFAAIQFARGETWGIFAAGSIWLVLVLVAVPFGIRLGGSGGAAAALALAFVVTLLSYPLGFARGWNVPLQPVAGPIAVTIGLPLALVLATLRTTSGFLPGVGIGLAAALAVFLVWGRPALGELRGAFVRA
jgi:O-antigen/teichoic acid export membrane protein